MFLNKSHFILGSESAELSRFLLHSLSVWRSNTLKHLFFSKTFLKRCKCFGLSLCFCFWILFPHFYIFMNAFLCTGTILRKEDLSGLCFCLILRNGSRRPSLTPSTSGRLLTPSRPSRNARGGTRYSSLWTRFTHCSRWRLPQSSPPLPPCLKDQNILFFCSFHRPTQFQSRYFQFLFPSCRSLHFLFKLSSECQKVSQFLGNIHSRI